MTIVAKNRKARFSYEIGETLEAGIQLTGAEVRSCRMSLVDLSGAYVTFKGDVPVLKQSTIRAYPSAHGQPHDEKRDRTLLLKKSQIVKLQKEIETAGMTLIPLEIHAKNHIKVLLGIAKGRSNVDKRHRIKERDIERRLKTGREM